MKQKNHIDVRITDLTLALRLLVRKFRSAAPAGAHGFSLAQKAVIERLEKVGPSTTADLARSEGIKPQSMGAIIASLEEMGMIEKKAHKTDGRQVVIELTEIGNAMRKVVTDAKLNWLTQAVAKLDKKEQDILFEAGEIMKRLVDL